MPAVEELDDRRLDLAVRRLADALDPGLEPSPHLGRGTDYLQSRPFADGDEIRAIDWKVTARTGRWFVKEHASLRRMPIILVVDTSASMRVASGARSKLALAIRLASAIALAGLRRLSPVGLVTAGGPALRHPPSLARSRVLGWLAELRADAAAPVPADGTWLGERLDRLGGQLHFRALVLVLSDLHDPTARPALRRLALHHDLAGLVLRDGLEAQPLAAGFIDASEAETGAGRFIAGRQRWRATGGEAADLQRDGIDACTVRTDAPVVELVSRFFAERGKRRAR